MDHVGMETSDQAETTDEDGRSFADWLQANASGSVPWKVISGLKAFAGLYPYDGKDIGAKLGCVMSLSLVLSAWLMPPGQKCVHGKGGEGHGEDCSCEVRRYRDSASHVGQRHWCEA